MSFDIGENVAAHMNHLLGLLPGESGYRSVSCSFETGGAMVTWTISVGDHPEEDES